MKKTLFAALLASSMIPAAALAQMSTTPTTGATDTAAPSETAPMTGATTPATSDTMNDISANATMSGEPFVTVAEGSRRLSDIDGVDVYGADGESIGTVSDVLVDDQGMVSAVLVGVGGFLGMGQKDVAVSMDALQFSTDVDQTTTAATTATGTNGMASTGTAGNMSAGTATTSPAGATATSGEIERITLSVTREQLENAPAYESDGGTSAN